jgi:site-specific recombinase XerD
MLTERPPTPVPLPRGGWIVPPNKGRTYPPEIVTAQEVNALLRGCSNRAPTGIRNRALLTILYRCGLRISEALSLMPKDIDALTGTLTVLKGKGGKRRVVGLDATAMDVLSRWLDRRREIGFNGRGQTRVFCTLSGTPMHAPYVRVLLARLARKAGLDRRVTPHTLRHSFAAEMAREGHAVNLIQAALGHSSLAVTGRYLDHLQPREVIETMRGRDWRLSEQRRA